MQRSFNLESWNTLEEGKALKFEGNRPRRVNLAVNAPGETLLYVDYGTGPTFLARVIGRDDLEFAVPGAFTLFADETSCRVFSVDGDNPAVVVPEAVTFTKIAERRPRNPELEQMQYLMMQNMEKRLAQQRVELDAIFAARANDTGAGASGAGGETSERDAATGSSSADSGEADSGSAPGEEPAGTVSENAQAADAGGNVGSIGDESDDK